MRKTKQLLLLGILSCLLIAASAFAQNQSDEQIAESRSKFETAERFSAFLARPDFEGYAKFYTYIVRHPKYDPAAVDFDKARDMFFMERYDQVIHTIESAWPNFLLTPQAHYLLTAAHKKLGNEEKAKRHTEIGLAVAKGMMRSGDGTQKRPFYVTRTIAERDLFRALEVKSVNQRRVRIENRSFDVHKLESGQEVWLEITFLLERLQSKK